MSYHIIIIIFYLSKKINLISKEPPKRIQSIDNNNEENNKEKVKRKRRKGKTHNIKNKSHRINKSKMKSIQPYKYKLKNDVLNNKEQNNIISNNRLIYLGSTENASWTNKNLNPREIPTIQNKKNYFDDFLILSNDKLNNKNPNLSIPIYSKSDLMINLTEGNGINIQEYLSTEPDDMIMMILLN